MNWLVVLPILAGIAGLRVLGAGLLAWVVGSWVGLYLFFAYGFPTPIPQSAIEIYMAISTLALPAYVFSNRERTEAFTTPLLRFATERHFTPYLVLVVLALPAVVMWNVNRSFHVRAEPPFFARTVHPSPPVEIKVHGNTIDVIGADNPYRELEESDPDAFRRHVENGRTVYYENCFYCHGDALAGDGMFAHGLNPIPTNFTDANVLPNFKESFFFWRIAKGGPGLPDEGGPWESAMPQWETFLSEEEIWDVVLFLYDFAGYRPRAKDPAAEH